MSDDETNATTVPTAPAKVEEDAADPSDTYINRLVRLYSGALTGASLLLISLIIPNDHPLYRSLAAALYLLSGSIPLLVGSFSWTFGQPEDEMGKITLLALGGIGVFLALGAILWHVNRPAAVIYIIATMLMFFVRFIWDRVPRLKEWRLADL